ncbi:hypothetical protein [Ancylobacter lacus]|uniref:hypothetical protein n=1 Tax=Ancylobacter lacus TaxID=2579970 RepID=UPI001BCD9FCF|nr:hypothetical protein [Ancylobacter lacus]MBS7539736.1 hypothetical protein [Ancylobacter lacus]
MSQPFGRDPYSFDGDNRPARLRGREGVVILDEFAGFGDAPAPRREYLPALDFPIEPGAAPRRPLWRVIAIGAALVLGSLAVVAAMAWGLMRVFEWALGL